MWEYVVTDHHSASVTKQIHFPTCSAIWHPLLSMTSFAHVVSGSSMDYHHMTSSNLWERHRVFQLLSSPEL